MTAGARLRGPAVAVKAADSDWLSNLLPKQVAEPTQKPAPALRHLLQPLPLARRSVMWSLRWLGRDDLVAELHAAIADVDAGTGHQLSNLVLSLSAERAVSQLPSRHARSMGTIGCPGASAPPSPTSRGRCQ